MDIVKVKELIKAVSDSDLTSFQVKEDNLEIVLSKNENEVLGNGMSAVESTIATKSETSASGQGETNTSSQGETDTDYTACQNKKSDNETAIKTPLVGTVYLAPGEGEEPFVKVGDTVKKGQVVAIVEAMKLMNEISCESDGVVSEILVENAQLVEYGQSLITIS